jgi:hypothetical protein
MHQEVTSQAAVASAWVPTERLASRLGGRGSSIGSGILTRPPGRFALSGWRRGRDSNPRRACALSGFQDRRNRPLCHPSAARILAAVDPPSGHAEWHLPGHVTAASVARMERRRRFADFGGLILALVLITVGGWYLLRNTFGLDMPEIDGDAIWPIIVLALGIGILSNAVRGRQEG